MMSPCPLPAGAAEPALRLPSVVLPDVGLERLPPGEVPKSAPQLDVPPSPMPPPGPPAAGTGARFVLSDVVLEGVTAYPEEELQAYASALIGKPVTLSDVRAIAREIERRYRQDGYFLVRALVPVQTVTDGRVRIVVLEGAVDAVFIEGDVGPVEDLIRSYLQPVLDQRPLKLATLERALLIANDIPGVSVSATLAPATRQTGAADLTVTAQRTPFAASFLVDNFGDDYTGRWEAASSVYSNSWTSAGEQIVITGFTTQPWSDHNQNVGQVTTSWRPPLDGLAISTIYSYGNSSPGSAVEQFDFDGKTLLAGVSISYPLIRSRAYDLNLLSGFDYINAYTDVFGGDTFTKDRLRVWFSGAQGRVRDGWNGVNTLQAGVRQGLPILDATKRDDEEKSRPDASGEATVLTGGVSRLQPLPADLSVYMVAAGQYAFSPLLTNEQFDLGGTSFGRGYAFNQVTGDSGIGGTVELRYDLALGLPALDRLQVFTFFDGGRVWNEQNVPGNQLSSAGAGIRLSPIPELTVELQMAKPLTQDSERANNTRDPQFLFRAVGRL